MDAEDLWFYQAAGRKGTELTGYPAISVYHEFRYHPKSVIGGTFDWIYEHLGVFSWVVEIWSPMREAGITDYKFIDWFRDHPIDDDLKLYRWSEDEARRCRAPAVEAVRASAAWQRRDRRLGPLPRVRQSAAAAARARARALSALAAVAGAVLAEARARACRCRPRSATARGKSRWSIQNTGWLPTYVSKRALARKTVRGIVAEIELPAGASLATGKLRDDVGQLEGKAVQAHRRFVLARLQRHRRPAEARVGRARRRRRDDRHHGAARARRHGARERCADERQAMTAAMRVPPHNDDSSRRRA